jgi:hypothetical protein
MGNTAQKTAIDTDIRDLSPVEVAPSRSVPLEVKLELVARSAGRCEFRGCNKFLYVHPLTGESGNFAENAHIVAFREKGPRGLDGERPQDIHDCQNLMLLCAPCHKLVDDNPEKYPRHELEAHKREHEARIKKVTDVGPDAQTTVLQVKARIGANVVEISQAEVFDALHPRYPAGETISIDLTSLGDEKGGPRYDVAAERIAEELARLYANGSGLQQTNHLSVFGLAPMPLLMTLGSKLSNKVPTDFFQCHRNKPNRWTWFEGEELALYETRKCRDGSDALKVALILSLSGNIDPASLPATVDDRYSVYEIRLASDTPNPGFLRQRADLEAFRDTYRRFLASMRAQHPGLTEIHTFPAAPAPVAIACGFDLLPKVDPTLVVYDNVMKDGGFIQRLKVNDHERQ